MTATRRTSTPAQLNADEPVFDCIGVGFGAANVALAIALEERDALDGILFLERGLAPDWQPEMLIEGTDIQHHPLRDLVTPRNPRSHYGFLSYLHAEGRLLDFLNLDAPFPPRTEYARYFRWVARHFDRVVRYGEHVVDIEPVDRGDRCLLRVTNADGHSRLARTVSFAPGRSPHVPEGYREHLGPRVVHVNDYLTSVTRWAHEGDVRRIGVVGGSQSAVEIVLDLVQRFPHASIVNINRGFSLKQKDLSPFTEQIYEPEFVDYFYNASEASQSELRRELWRSNYGASDHDVIARLRFMLYEQKLTGRERVKLLSNQRLVEMAQARKRPGYRLRLEDRHSAAETKLDLDALILATGFRDFGAGAGQERYHPLLGKLAPRALFRADGGIAQRRDFTVPPRDDRTAMPDIFLNGVSEATHGFGDAGSFSLLSQRSDLIADRIVQALREEAAPSADRASPPASTVV